MIKPYDMARSYGFFIPRQARPILQLFAFLDFSSDFLTDFGFFWSDFLTDFGFFFWSDFLTDFILLSVGRRASRASLSSPSPLNSTSTDRVLGGAGMKSQTFILGTVLFIYTLALSMPF